MSRPPLARQCLPRVPGAPLILALLSLLLAAGAGEAFVRLSGRTDADGMFAFRELPIRPYALPIERTRELLAAYERTPGSYVAYDPDLGWTLRPLARTQDGLHRANAAGLRAEREYTLPRPPDTLRIALFGDSFMHGSDVRWEESLSPLLETRLRQRGIAAEVLNFGVGGYGFDQAWLRYRRDGRPYRPHVVVQGLQLENVARTVNLFRLLYYAGSGIPFSKPRFVREGSTLRIVNQPTLAIDDIVSTLTHFAASPMRQYEHFHVPQDYERRWYHPSRFAATFVDIAQRRAGRPTLTDICFRPGSEASELTRAILAAFRGQVEADGGRFRGLYLPQRVSLQAQLTGRGDPDSALLTHLTEGLDIVNPLGAIAAAGHGSVGPLFSASHYSGAANGALAESLADHLVRTGAIAVQP